MAAASLPTAIQLWHTVNNVDFHPQLACDPQNKPFGLGWPNLKCTVIAVLFEIEHLSHTYPPMPHTILLVDDSPDVRQIVRRFLQRDTAFNVAGEADSGLEAIKIAEELRPDLILLDLKMPGLNGIETAAVLKRVLPRTQIVLFSAYTESLGGTTLASAVGIDLVVQKGSLADMAQSLKTLISRKWISPVTNPTEPTM